MTKLLLATAVICATGTVLTDTYGATGAVLTDTYGATGAVLTDTYGATGAVLVDIYGASGAALVDTDGTIKTLHGAFAGFDPATQDARCQVAGLTPTTDSAASCTV